MTHCINAIVARREALSILSARLGDPAPTELRSDLFILPLDEDRLDALAVSSEEPLHGFSYLTPAMVTSISAALGGNTALYLETEYFGGTGGQGAALFEGGALKWTDAQANEIGAARALFGAGLAGVRRYGRKSPISRGLAALGVASAEGKDEFDVMGLGRFRSLRALGLGMFD